MRVRLLNTLKYSLEPGSMLLCFRSVNYVGLLEPNVIARVMIWCYYEINGSVDK